MTVRINFLPRNYQPPRRWSATEWGLVAAAAVTVAVAGTYYTSVYTATAKLERQANADQVALEKVKAGLAQAEEIKAREAQVTKAESDLRSLAGRRWSSVLLTLSQLTPRHVSWSSISTKGDELSLSGTSRNLVDMAQLLGGLVTESSVAEIRLKTITESGSPTEIIFKAGDASKAMEGLASLGADGPVKEMTFQMVITLVPAEGRQLPHGA